MAAIETRNLCHSYRRHLWQTAKPVLRGLDLLVEEGEIFGYLGANGAGKTTTIKILTGLQSAGGGEARLFGVSCRDVRARRMVGFQPENPYFYEFLSAEETIRFYAALCGVPRRERAARGAELLELMGLREAARVRVRDFSKGMRQRLGIAQALVHRPRLVILDEPMSGLDPVGRLQVREAIASLRTERGATVFFSSHILADVEMLCDRVGLLVEGRLQAAGPLRELLEARSRRVEVGAEGLSPAARAELSARAVSALEEGSRTVFTFADTEAAEAAVERIRADGARLRLLQPHRETLEEYFMRSTGKARAEVGAWKGGGEG
jgi:ABC-2 type transport system ATP-binding protein